MFSACVCGRMCVRVWENVCACAHVRVKTSVGGVPLWNEVETET